MEKFNLRGSPDIVAAIAIFEEGKEEALVQKSHRNTGDLSQSLFFEKFKLDEFEIQLRLDYDDLSGNRDPTLDANVFKDRKELAKDNWHRTPKILSGGEWVYEWAFRGHKLRFKVQTTNQKDQPGKALIAPPPVNSAPIPSEEAQARAAADEKFKTLMGIANDPLKEAS